MRINGYIPGGAVDGVDWFIERWNEGKQKYEIIARDLVNRHLWLWSIVDMFWTDNDTVLFERNSGGHPSDFTEMKIIERREINHSQNNGNMIEVAFKHEAVAGGLTVRYDNYMHETAIFDPDGPEVSGTVYSLTLTHRDADGKPIREETVEFDSYRFETQGWILLTWEPYEIRIVAHGEKSLKMEVKKQPQ